ncbi:MAG TPA: peptidoglycan recognition family protein [Jiangellaceae bacterium]|nr:peptidoglycan recognition family protein [Jiangellaceae bacterium]
MVQYLPRSAWTSTSASGATLTGSKLRGVAVHWPGTTQAAIGDPGREAIAERLRSYRNHHVNTNGWQDIGYNVAIDQAGRVWMLRSTQWRGNLVGAHCASATNRDANEEYVGVLLLLGQTERLSQAMVAAFRDWYHNRFLPGWPRRTDVRGHGQVAGAQTECPGAAARSRIADGTLTAKPVEPEPEPTPTIRRDPGMLMVKQAGTDRIWLIDGQVRRHVRTVSAMNALRAAGIPLDTEHPITSALLRSLTPAPQGPDITDQVETEGTAE